METFCSFIENYILCLLASPHYAADLQFESTPTIPFYNFCADGMSTFPQISQFIRKIQIRYTVEAVFASYTLAFFFSLAFEKPFNKIDEMLFDSKKMMNGEKGKSNEMVPLNKRVRDSE